MAETVPVRCPACHREHRYTAPAYPCVCGAPVAPPLDRDGSATPVAHRVWQDDWVTVRCGSCGRRGEWPRPEVGCACGVVLRVAVVEGPRTGGGQDAAAGGTSPPESRMTGQDTAGGQGRTSGQEAPAGQDNTCEQDTAADQDGTHDQRAAAGLDPTTGPRETAAAPADATAPTGIASASAKPPFRSVTIRTALDAVTATALYLRWLGYRGVRRADQRPPSGIGLAARGVLAQVDPAVRPATLRDVECLWLTAMTESAECLYFSLTGYAADARARADALGVPLFVLDLTGTPRPVNTPAEALASGGSEDRAP
ncbi:hypothetical protein [Streptomyces hawaiiensis]|uniref:Restriction endonuclease type IV Mrr domain-containing protein n=1 Tax=Streptomyces hawaiiensis TaxID=67305 RepID=A0A6G5RMK5_9ACTN|nr:hypothetical protein [Streptomyces hawaiiensis]QCD59069.1 hypothetical protein CEB94_32725 [Streptomyces hawaiiensis]